ncbi:MAG: DUF503 domain-containing protein [Deltaproteobacteria bacterium]|nr:DUF503 domain-containing protein [Deltaproteobacteria bacterium]
MFVGICRLELHLAGNNSLKGKRRIIRSMIDRTRAKFNISVAEVADNDVLRRAVIGAAVVGNTSAHVDAMLGRIGSYMEKLGLAPVSSLQTEVIPLGDEIGRFGETGVYNEQWNDSPEDDEGVEEEDEW